MVPACEVTMTKLQSIAHVGRSRPRTDADETRFLCAGVLAEALGFKLPKTEAWDVININYGRDFLKEDKTYDMVVLYSIFYCALHEMPTWEQKMFMPECLDDPQFTTSELHKAEAWRNRLLSTKAKLIVVCAGQPWCLDRHVLGGLNGYRVAASNELVTAYVETAHEVPGKEAADTGKSRDIGEGHPRSWRQARIMGLPAV